MSRAEFAFEAYTRDGEPIEGSIVIDFDAELTAEQVEDMADRILDRDWTSLTTISTVGGAM